MEWISFFWGVGALLFINIVYTLLVYPKQLKQMKRMEDRILLSESIVSETEAHVALLKKERNDVRLALERLESSIKLRKSCPVCGEEFPLYVLEEDVK